MYYIISVVPTTTQAIMGETLLLATQTVQIMGRLLYRTQDQSRRLRGPETTSDGAIQKDPICGNRKVTLVKTTDNHTIVHPETVQTTKEVNIMATATMKRMAVVAMVEGVEETTTMTDDPQTAAASGAVVGMVVEEEVFTTDDARIVTDSTVEMVRFETAGAATSVVEISGAIETAKSSWQAWISMLCWTN